MLKNLMMLSQSLTQAFKNCHGTQEFLNINSEYALRKK